ncbi:MAG: flagellar biosynthetic protein FliQ [Terriglobia bacterium]|jgi:flagellar biosynthetic protein FliQ
MSADMAVELARKTLETAFLLSAPILLVALVTGLLVSVLQVMTSVQDITISTVPRLFAVALTTFLLLPWSLRKLLLFTLEVLTDLRRYLG